MYILSRKWETANKIGSLISLPKRDMQLLHFYLSLVSSASLNSCINAPNITARIFYHIPTFTYQKVRSPTLIYTFPDLFYFNFDFLFTPSRLSVVRHALSFRAAWSYIETPSLPARSSPWPKQILVCWKAFHHVTRMQLLDFYRRDVRAWLPISEITSFLSSPSPSPFFHFKTSN